MKLIVDSGIPDKPYLLPLNPDIKVFEKQTNCFLNSSDTADILLTETQKRRLQTLRCRIWWFVSWLPPPLFQTVLESDSQYVNYAYCYHNQDLNEDNSLKKPHTHCILFTSSNITASNIAFRFHTVDISALSKDSFKYRFDYLTHNSDDCFKKGKHLYDDSEIVSNDIDFIKSHCIEHTDNKAYLMYSDYLNGVPYSDMLKKYGFTFLQNIRNLDILRKSERCYISFDRFQILESSGDNVTLQDKDGSLFILNKSELLKNIKEI